MPCYKPIQAFQCVDGSIVFSELRRFDVSRSLQLPCGQCVGCRLERSRQWAVRCMHEASLYDRNCFITLTYSPEHLPADGSLRYADFQLFMKRLRKRFKGHREVPGSAEPRPIRFYMCGEYGETFGRPHYHACLFNFDFEDKVHLMRTKSGSRVFRSKALEELWPFGFSSIGAVNFESAAYVARYVMKKITGDAAKSHYERVDPDTGEISQLIPEFNKMSLKPGIGGAWFDKYSSDVYPRDYVVVNGRKVKPPRYYDKLFADDYPVEFEGIQYSRYLDALSRVSDNTSERLAVKEKVAIASVSRLSRSLEV